MGRYISEEVVEEFQKNGVVFLQGFFSNHWLNLLRAGIKKNLNEPGPNQHIWSKEDEGQFTLYDSDNWRKIPEYENFIKNSNMKEVACQLLRTKKVNFFFDAIFVRSEGVQFSTPWHQDEPYWSIEGQDTVSIWMPLVDVRKQSALAFVPGSHLSGKKFKQQDFGQLNPEKKDNVRHVTFSDEWELLPNIDEDRKKYKVISWDMKAGDCVAFNARIIHGGGGNLLPGHSLKVFNTQWLGDDVRVSFRSYGMDPDHSQKMKKHGMKSGDLVDGRVYPEFRV